MTEDLVAEVFETDHGVFLIQYLAFCSFSSQLPLNKNKARPVDLRGMSWLRATVLFRG